MNSAVKVFYWKGLTMVLRPAWKKMTDDRYVSCIGEVRRNGTTDTWDAYVIGIVRPLIRVAHRIRVKKEAQRIVEESIQ